MKNEVETTNHPKHTKNFHNLACVSFSWCFVSFVVTLFHRDLGGAGAGRPRHPARAAGLLPQLAEHRPRPGGKISCARARPAQPRRVPPCRGDDVRNNDGGCPGLARRAGSGAGHAARPQHGREGGNAAGLPPSGAGHGAHRRGYRAEGVPLGGTPAGICRDERTRFDESPRTGGGGEGVRVAGQRLGDAKISAHESRAGR